MNDDKELEPTEVVEIDEKRETIHFPWGVAIFMGFLMAAIIACLVIILVLEHYNSEDFGFFDCKEI